MLSSFRCKCIRWMLVVLSSSFLLSSVIADGLNPIQRPAAGDVVPVNQPYTIKWSPGTSGPVSIKILFNNNQASQTIVDSTQNDGSYLWTPDSSLASVNNGQNYFLQICDLKSGDCTYTFDGRFSFSGIVSTTTSAVVPTTTSVSSVAPSTTSSIIPSSTVTTTTSPSTSAVSSSSASSTTLPSSQVDSTSTSTSSTTSSSLSTETTHPVTTSSTSTEPTTTSSSTTAVSHPSPSPSSGLSAVAKIAIGVVASIIGTAALLIGAYLISRLHRRKRNRHRISQYQVSSQTRAELFGAMRYEVSADGSGKEKVLVWNRHELADNRPAAVELPHY